ncbi:hypothetical protein [Clostridium sp. Cult1]|uniref:hypothetical protein n=1 Tax=Clostridium sp. Cult1 TaxID=2079002 RepID=UPI001F41CD65|nr:hypothetical protein [Clostridium sp. Cult1]MCF6464167.1 hypothetical protein [Clostridium sp. Cult1]
MENVNGFKKLTVAQQQLLIMTNAKHKAGVGTDYKEDWTPVSVKPLGRNLKVTFKNGEWLHYAPDGTWY